MLVELLESDDRERSGADTTTWPADRSWSRATSRQRRVAHVVRAPVHASSKRCAIQGSPAPCPRLVERTTLACDDIRRRRDGRADRCRSGTEHGRLARGHRPDRPRPGRGTRRGHRAWPTRPASTSRSTGRVDRSHRLRPRRARLRRPTISVALGRLAHQLLDDADSDGSNLGDFLRLLDSGDWDDPSDIGRTALALAAAQRVGDEPLPSRRTKGGRR